MYGLPEALKLKIAASAFYAETLNWLWSKLRFMNREILIVKSSLNFRVYEGRLRSSWTHLITLSQNRVEVRWRSLFEVPPLASDELLATLHPILENVLQTVDHFEISYLWVTFSWLEKPRSRMGRDLDCMADILMGFHRSTFSKRNKEFNSDLAPCDFWAFSIMKRELQSKKFRSDQRSAARFREVGGAL
jgi:hypothetical protein